jgi:hypothetical protein
MAAHCFELGLRAIYDVCELTTTILVLPKCILMPASGFNDFDCLSYFHPMYKQEVLLPATVIVTCVAGISDVSSSHR